MNYFIAAAKVAELLENKFSARKIDIKNIAEIFPCCGFEDNKLVELKPEEKTIALYTEEEITVDNYECYLIDDETVIKNSIDIRKSDGVVPQKVLNVIGLNAEKTFTLQLYTCFGKCYAWYNDLIDLYVREIIDNVNAVFGECAVLKEVNDGYIVFNVFSKRFTRIEINADLNLIRCFHNDILDLAFSLENGWIDRLKRELR